MKPEEALEAYDALPEHVRQRYSFTDFERYAALDSSVRMRYEFEEWMWLGGNAQATLETDECSKALYAEP